MSVEECLRLLEAVPAAASSSPAFRRHWPSISASLAALSAALSSPSFPPAAPLLSPLAAALSTLLSAAAAYAPRMGHLHTVSLLSSSSASLSQLAADARLHAAPPPPPSSSAGGADSSADALISRLRVGSAASRAAALEELATTAASLPPSAAALAVPAVAALLDSPGGDLLPSTRERAVAVLAAFASSSAACRFLSEEPVSAAVVPHLCRALESSGAAGAGAAEHACLALLPLTAASRDAAAAVAARGGVAALLAACAGGTPATQAAAAGVLRNLASFPDLLPWFLDEPAAVPLLLQLVSLGTPRAQELALACLQNLTSAAGGGGGGDDGHQQRLRVEAFQEGALAVVRDYLDGAAGTRGGGRDEPAGLAPALGFLRNMASFRYIAEIASGFAAHVAAALGSDRSATRTEAALALAELCGNAGGKSRREVEEEAVVARLVWMMDAAKAACERGAAARALAALMASSGACRKVFRKDERGVAAAVRMLDPAAGGRDEDRRFAVAVLVAVAQSRRCRKQMVAAGACGFVQGMVAEEVEGAKKLAECLGKGKMLGVFPRT
ncbi:unnamed protein product [Urochloa decumbens]|uniref:ARM repeat superfamily protein n=1 Tax=Urochloa decumbens TaxID=240449 RepID=A0ABC9B704_9POAL